MDIENIAILVQSELQSIRQIIQQNGDYLKSINKFKASECISKLTTKDYKFTLNIFPH